jgi:deoxyguanosine kinase
MKPGVRRIEICGGIASGKTTLANILRNDKVISVFEDFKSNPFYSAFYADQVGSAFETELTFLLQHYHQEKLMVAKGVHFCCDFSIVLDWAYARVTLARDDRGVFQKVHRRVERSLPSRSLLIFLDCTAEIQLYRIRQRRRRAERTITSGYLEKINDSLARRLRELSADELILTIDSGAVDFAHNSRAQVSICRQVDEILSAV